MTLVQLNQESHKKNSRYLFVVSKTTKAINSLYCPNVLYGYLKDNISTLKKYIILKRHSF